MVFFSSFIICCVLWILFYFVNKLENWDYKLSSSFECGFFSFFSSRYSYSIPFFFLTIVFLFLDLEFCFILPYFLFDVMIWFGFNLFVIFTFLVITGVIIEWVSGSLNWMS